MKNKCIGIYLAVILIFNMCSVFTVSKTVSAVEISESDNRKIRILSALNMIDENDERIGSDGLITRAEFAVMTVKFLGYDDALEAEAGDVFLDVGAEHYAAREIGLLKNIGVIAGESRDEFFPDNVITYPEAVKILVSSFGYMEEAEYSGGFPYGYLTVATQLNMLGNVSSEVDFKVCANLFYNSLEIEVSKIIAVTESNFIKSKELKVIEYFHNIYKETGQVSVNYISTLSGESMLPKEKVIIGDVQYMTGTTDAASLLGYNVTFYYSDDKKDGLKTIMYIEKNIAKTKELVIYAEENPVFYDWKISYDGKRSGVTVNNNAYIIYNGRGTLSELSTLFPVVYGSITLVDFGVGYELVIINDYRNLVVQDIDTNRNIIFNKYNSAQNIDLSGTSILCEMFDIDDNPVELSYIKQGYTVSYAMSDDEKYIKMFISPNILEGMVTEVSDKELIIEDETYRFALHREEKAFTDLSAGSYGYFNLDYFGAISAFRSDATASEVLMAYVAAADIAEGVDSKVRMKVYDLSDYSIKIMTVARKAMVNGKTHTNPQNIIEQFKRNGDFKAQIITYELNGDGDIKTMNTAYVDESDKGDRDVNSLRYFGATNTNGNLVTSHNLSFKYYVKSLGGKFHITSKTKIISVPSDHTNEKAFGTLSIDYFTADTRYNVEAYALSAETLVPDVIVVNSDSGAAKKIDSHTRLSLVDKVTSALNDDDEKVQKLYYVRDGVASQIIIEKKYLENNPDVLDKLQPGNVIRYGTNGQSELNSLELIYTDSTKTFEAASNPFYMDKYNDDPFSTIYRIIYADVIKKNGDYIKISAAQTKSDPADTESYEEIYTANRFKISVYDREAMGGKGKARVGNFNDIIDLESSEELHSKVIISTRYGDSQCMVIIND